MTTGRYLWAQHWPGVRHQTSLQCAVFPWLSISWPGWKMNLNSIKDDTKHSWPVTLLCHHHHHHHHHHHRHQWKWKYFEHAESEISTKLNSSAKYYSVVKNTEMICRVWWRMSVFCHHQSITAEAVVSGNCEISLHIQCIVARNNWIQSLCSLCCVVLTLIFMAVHGDKNLLCFNECHTLHHNPPMLNMSITMIMIIMLSSHQ